MYRIFVFIAITLSFIACNPQVETSPLNISGEKTANTVHIGKGVWMNLPPNYKKARSYFGYQTSDLGSSISVKTSIGTIASILELFTPECLSKSRCKLIEKREVLFEDKYKGYYFVVKDNRKKTYRHLLAIQKGMYVYKIKAFYFQSQKSTYDPIVRSALKTSQIGKKEERFKMAKSDLETGIEIFTQDGNYPTETSDSLQLEIKEIDNTSIYAPEKYVINEKINILGDTNESYEIELLSNGKIVSTKGEKNNVKCRISLFLLDGSDSGKLYTFIGNKEVKFDDLKFYLERQLTTISLK